MKTQNHPQTYTPRCPADFIGGAKAIAQILANKAKAAKSIHTPIKILLYGVPGVGKTRLAEMLAAQLTGQRITEGQSLNTESVNGRNVDITIVRRWQEESRYIPFSWTVRIVNELDTCLAASQDLLLTVLDELPRKSAFIGTSNLSLGDLVERFQTRLQQFKVTAPDTGELNGFLKQWKLGAANIKNIAVGCGGNVRAALLDAQSILEAQAV